MWSIMFIKSGMVGFAFPHPYIIRQSFPSVRSSSLPLLRDGLCLPLRHALLPQPAMVACRSCASVVTALAASAPALSAMSLHKVEDGFLTGGILLPALTDIIFLSRTVAVAEEKDYGL